MQEEQKNYRRFGDLLINRRNAFLCCLSSHAPCPPFVKDRSTLYHKMDAAVEVIRSEVKNSIMRRKMLRLLALIPEKNSE